MVKSITKEFLDNVVSRFIQIPNEFRFSGDVQVITETCTRVRDILTNRPKHQLFQDGIGSRIIPQDFPYLFPATVGIDIRQYLKGDNFLFDSKALEADIKNGKWNPATTRTLTAIARLILLISCYNLYHDVDKHVTDDHILEKYHSIGQQFEREVTTITSNYLYSIIDTPLKAKIAKLDEAGRVVYDESGEKSKVLLEQIQDNLQQHKTAISLSSLIILFQRVCDSGTIAIGKRTWTIDFQLGLEINLIKLIQQPLPIPTLQKILRQRYSYPTFLYAYSFHKKLEQKKLNLRSKFLELLHTENQDGGNLSDEAVETLCNFLVGDNQNNQLFWFDDPNAKELKWKLSERRSVYLGEYHNQKIVSPEHILTSENIKKCKKRPVVVLVDISSSMSPFLNYMLGMIEEIFNQFQGHPISLSFFSSTAGVLNQGQPFLAKKKSFCDTVRWVAPLLQCCDEYPGLAIATSIGNAVLLAKAIATGIASQMEMNQEWMDKTQINSHIVLLSDNIHNTPRDIAPLSKKGKGYDYDSPQNVIQYALESGCSIHNIVPAYDSFSASTAEHKNLKLSLMEDLQSLKSKGLILEALQKDQPLLKKLEEQLQYVATSGTGSKNNGQRMYKVTIDPKKQEHFQVRTKDWGGKGFNQQVAAKLCYFRLKSQENTLLKDAIEKILRKINLDFHEFRKDSVNMGQLIFFFDEIEYLSKVSFDEYYFGHLDGSPIDVLEIGECITETQRKIKNFSLPFISVSGLKKVFETQVFGSNAYFGVENGLTFKKVAQQLGWQVESLFDQNHQDVDQIKNKQNQNNAENTKTSFPV